MRLVSNADRARILKLNPAPSVKGYAWSKEEIEGVIRHNRDFEDGRVEKPMFLAVYIDLTPSCNLNCRFCYSSSEMLAEGHQPRVGLTWDEIRNCINTANEFGAKTICVAGRGEPTIDPSFMAMARYITEKGMWFVAFTNNMYLTPEVAAELAGLNVSIIAKLGSLDARMQDKIVGKKGAHYAIRRGLDHLLKSGFGEWKLGIDATIYRETMNGLADVFKFCRQNKIVPYFEALIETGEVLRDPRWLASQRLTDDELVAFFHNLREIDEKGFGYTWVITPKMHSLANEDCRKNMTTLSIRDDGSVNTCVNERYSDIGNIREIPLEQLIISSPTLRRYRSQGAFCCSRTCGIVPE